MSVNVEHFILGSVGTNVYVLYDTVLKEAVVVDPADNGADIFEAINNAGLEVAGILLTHGHFDHIGGVDELRKKSGCKVWAFSGEKDLLTDPSLNESASMGRKPVSVNADVYLSDGEILNIGGMEITAIATPGHTSGSMCFYIPEEKILLSGDTLFEGSVGRTDLPTGSMSAIVRSVKEKLMILPEDVTVYPGHGPFTTIGEEKRYNPFL